MPIGNAYILLFIDRISRHVGMYTVQEPDFTTDHCEYFCQQMHPSVGMSDISSVG